MDLRLVLLGLIIEVDLLIILVIMHSRKLLISLLRPHSQVQGVTTSLRFSLSPLLQQPLLQPTRNVWTRYLVRHVTHRLGLSWFVGTLLVLLSENGDKLKTGHRVLPCHLLRYH